MRGITTTFPRNKLGHFLDVILGVGKLKYDARALSGFVQ